MSDGIQPPLITPDGGVFELYNVATNRTVNMTFETNATAWLDIISDIAGTTPWFYSAGFSRAGPYTVAVWGGSWRVADPPVLPRPSSVPGLTPAMCSSCWGSGVVVYVHGRAAAMCKGSLWG